jgi:hypothetical protein
MRQTYTLEKRHVNSEPLADEITNFINDIIETFSVMWDNDDNRNAVLEIMDEHLEDLADEKKIIQWNIVCDGRNNKKSDIENKTTHLDITYKQRNCFNVTELKYTIKNI